MILKHRYKYIEYSVPLMLVAAWFGVSYNSESLYFPPLGDIMVKFSDYWLADGIRADIIPSLERLGLGFAIATFGGIAIGVVIGLSEIGLRLLMPTVEFMRAVPSVVLIPFGIAIMGPGVGMKVFIIALGSAFPIILNTADGVRNIENTLIDVSRAYQLSGWTRLIKVRLAAAGPQIFSGLRVAVALALILMVVSEMVASTNGIGYRLLMYQRVFKINDMWSSIVVLAILGFLLTGLISSLSHYVLKWHRGYSATMAGDN